MEIKSLIIPDLNILNFHKIELENETKLLNQDIKNLKFPHQLIT
jgi:hypothetical protein